MALTKGRYAFALVLLSKFMSKVVRTRNWSAIVPIRPL